VGARSAGMKTAAYVLLNYDNLVCPTFAHPIRDQQGKCSGAPILQEQPGSRWQVRQGLAALGAELSTVAFVAIDVEWFASPAPSLDSLQQARRAAYILEAIDELKTHNKKPVIYTRNATGHWSDITGCGMQSRLPVCTALFKAINDPVAPVALWDALRSWTISVRMEAGRAASDGNTDSTPMRSDCPQAGLSISTCSIFPYFCDGASACPVKSSQAGPFPH